MTTAGVNCRLLEEQFDLVMLRVNAGGNNVSVAKLTQSGAHSLAVQKG